MVAFDDSDKVGADVVLLHGCPQSFMQNPVEGLLEVYEDMVEVLLLLEIFSQRIHRLKICSVVPLPALKPEEQAHTDTASILSMRNIEICLSTAKEISNK